jgi:aminopeptidase N
MNFTGEGATTAKPDNTTRESRKASTGSMPDFAHQGEGVKIGSVISGSAGDKAGLKAGDIIMMLDDVKITDLRQYSNLLKKYQPGDVVKLHITRQGKMKDISLELDER